MRDLILFSSLVAVAVWIQRGPTPVVEPTCYIGLLTGMAYFAGKISRRLGLPVETGYVGIGVAARVLHLIPASLVQVSHPLIAMAIGWVGFGIGVEVVRARDRWRPGHLTGALMGAGLPCVCALLILKALTGIPTAVALTLAVAASLSDPVLTFAASDHLPATTLISVFCGVVSLVLFVPLSTHADSLWPFLLGVGWGTAVAAFWAESLVRVEGRLKADTSLAVLLLTMVILLHWTSSLLRHSTLLSAVVIGGWVAWRSGAQDRFRRIGNTLGHGMGALLLSAFGVQIAVGKLAELPAEVWGIAAIYLAAMVGGKLLAGLLFPKGIHPYGRLAGLALLPQGPLLIEIDAQVRGRAGLFGGSEDTIHTVLTVAALVGSLALPILDHLLRRVALSSAERSVP